MVKPNTEDKQAWVEIGVQAEKDFLNNYGKDLGVIMNPARAKNKFAPDLMTVADLKTVNTPFFTANRYGLDPQYTVFLNRKDYLRYSKLYPTIIIYYHVNWKQLDYYGNRIVQPMHGVWRASLFQISRLIKNGAILHTYKKRVEDTSGNAKASYLFDVREFELCYYEE